MILIPALAILIPFLAQANGNLIVPALLLVFGLGAMLFAAGHPGGNWLHPVNQFVSSGRSHGLNTTYRCRAFINDLVEFLPSRGHFKAEPGEGYRHCEKRIS